MSNLRKILINKNLCKSVWFMRQAGRYLPEFRKIRKKNQNFINLCLNSDLSSEITLQPIKRFNLDSAIIFSDILLVPYALGQSVKFNKKPGPKLSDFNSKILFSNNEKKFSQKLGSVYKAIEITRNKLNKNKSLICFVGAPWTLIVYMLGLKKNKAEINLDKLNSNSILLNDIINELIKYLCIHIKNQINAGADVVQIFDSWAGLIPKKDINKYCYEPNAKIVEFCNLKKIPNICFPKGLNKDFEEFNKIVKPDGINIDHDIEPSWAKDKLKDVVIQGGLNPRILLKSKDKMFQAATKYFETFKDIPYIFNLGHGLLPETDPDKVDELIKFYRNFNE
tara:strand:- start:442 stop:1452 length:1011 start_codon:yes stop_codon:yes gene_type:complete